MRLPWRIALLAAIGRCILTLPLIAGDCLSEKTTSPSVVLKQSKELTDLDFAAKYTEERLLLQKLSLPDLIKVRVDAQSRPRQAAVFYSLLEKLQIGSARSSMREALGDPELNENDNDCYSGLTNGSYVHIVYSGDKYVRIDPYGAHPR